jgi:glycosyltransferase involved in cell wall biosynthesis
MTFPTPVISVCVITYNQCEYIGQAIASVLAQETGFSTEIVVGDDSSTDGTSEVVRDLAKKHPTKMRMLPSVGRLGIAGNIRASLEACKGTYIALLEGDDYWTASNKLERQVAALEARPDCALCFHPVAVREEGDAARSAVQLPVRAAGTYGLNDLLQGNFIPTGSVVFRRSAYRGLPHWLDNMKMIDWPLFVQLATSGRLLMLPDVMGVYRLHRGGVWSATSGIVRRQEAIEAMEGILTTTALDEEQVALIRDSLARRLLALAWDTEATDPAKARRYARGSVRARLSRELARGQAIALLTTHLPRLARALRRARRLHQNDGS